MEVTHQDVPDMKSGTHSLQEEKDVGWKVVVFMLQHEVTPNSSNVSDIGVGHLPDVIGHLLAIGIVGFKGCYLILQCLDKVVQRHSGANCEGNGQDGGQVGDQRDVKKLLVRPIIVEDA